MFFLHVLLSLALNGQSATATTRVDASWDSVRPLDVKSSRTGMRYAADELLIGLERPGDRTACVARLASRGARLIGEVPSLRVLRVELPAGEDPIAVAPQYAALPGVRYAEPNGVGEGGSFGAPSDTHFARQWHLRNTGQDANSTPGSDIAAEGAWSQIHHAERVVLAIVDSGIDFAHPEFIGRTLPGWDFVSEDGDPTADNAHGIWCAGAAAANADNGFGVAGVSPTCTILPLRVLGATGAGTVLDFAQAMMYCAANRVDVVSISLINFPSSVALEDSLAAARAAGCILVACAGNGGLGDADVCLPGASIHTLSIGWTRSDDRRVLFSSTGAQLDFVAPGSRIVTVHPTSHADVTQQFSGCSAATPIAAGIIALLKSRVPDLTQEDVYELLKLGAEDQVGIATEDTPGRDDFHGWGRLNAERSLAVLSECPATLAYGESKPTSLGTRPVVTAHGMPRASWSDFAIDVESAIPGELAVVFHGSARGAEAWNGGTLLVRPRLTHLPAKMLDASGRARFAIPVDPSMVNTHRYFQAWFRDPAHPDGTAMGVTNALDVVFCP